MIIVNEKYNFSVEDAHSHLKIPFKLENTYKRLNIKLDFEPGITPFHITRQIADSFEAEFIPEEYRVGAMKEFIETVVLENVITTSLTYNESYLGAWHNKCPNQDIVISSSYSSLGYVKHAIEPGCYVLTLSLHSINCPVEAVLSVEVQDE